MNIKKICVFVCFTLILAVCPCTQNYTKAQSLSNQNVINLPIVMYHTVMNKNAGKYSVTPAMLENDFRFLIQNGYTTIFVGDLVDFQQNGTPLPKKPIIITFDDGSKTNFIHAFPLMQKYNVKCAFSVVGAYIDSNYDSNGALKKEAFAYLNYTHIRQMQASGLAEFVSHSYNMHSLGERKGMCIKKGESQQSYKKILADDLSRNQAALKNNADISCNAVAFPFGAYCPATIDVIKQMGFKAALTCTEGVNKITPDSSLFYLKRFNRPASASTKKFFARFD